MTSRHADLPKRIALTDERRGGSPFEQLERLGPTDAIILRHYDTPSRARADLAKKLRLASVSQGVRLLIAGDQRLAHHVKADGLHLPRWLVKRGYDWRRRVQPGFVITAAAHNEAELIAAAQSGVDAALLSPVFPTASHPEANALGPVKFATLAGRVPIPVYALGGVTRTTVQRLAGVENRVGWAAVSGI